MAAPQHMSVWIPLGLLGVAAALMASITSREEKAPMPGDTSASLGPGHEGWIYDPSAGTYVPPPAPSVQGAGPTRGEWPYDGLPFRVTFDGRLFQRSAQVPRGVAGYYREVRGKGELAVTAKGRFVAV